VYGLPSIAGVLVFDVSSGSPAGEAGLVRHDVIVAIDGVRVDRVGQMQREIAQREPGDTVTVRVIRYGDTVTLGIRLGEATLPPRIVSRRAETDPIPDLGLVLDDLDEATAAELGYADTGGALIAGVEPLSPADRKRIFPGMRLLAVGDVSVATAAEARVALGAVGSGRVASLLLQSPDGATFIANVRNN
jgi:serine protease Do